MKNAIFSAIFMAFILISCNTKNKIGEATSETTKTTEQVDGMQMYACSMHPEITGHKGEMCTTCGMELTKSVANSEAVQEHHDADASINKNKDISASGEANLAMKDILNSYLKLKNALTQDDAKGAATAGKALSRIFSSINPNSIEAKDKKQYLNITDDAKEHAEHIGDNADKIDHQREHFVMLSNDLNDLIKIFGSANQKLYQDFCPMADEGKGAIWISEFKEIKNPYKGSKMLTCGSVKKQL